MRKGWKETTLGEVAEVTMGQSPPGSSYNEAGDGLAFMQGSAEFGAVNPTPVKWCTDPSRIAETGDILVSVRAPVGDTNVADQRIAIGRGLAAVSAREDAALTPFIWTVIQLKVAELNSVSGSGMFASITGRNFRGLGILLPPLAEQKRIVDVIGAVDAYVASLESYAHAARTARAALLHELLTTNTKGWKETTLGEVADFINGYPFKPNDLGDEGIPVIRIKQLLDVGEPVDRTNVLVPLRCQLRDGDLVFSWSGTLAIRSWNRGPAYLNQHLFRVVEREGVQRSWLALCIDNAIGELSEKSHGTTMKHITKKTLLPHAVDLPPLAEQRRIVDVIGAVDGAIAGADRAAEDARNLRSGLLSDLLSGDHGIPEAYDELLESA